MRFGMLFNCKHVRKHLNYRLPSPDEPRGDRRSMANDEGDMLSNGHNAKPVGSS